MLLEDTLLLLLLSFMLLVVAVEVCGLMDSRAEFVSFCWFCELAWISEHVEVDGLVLSFLLVTTSLSKKRFILYDQMNE